MRAGFAARAVVERNPVSRKILFVDDDLSLLSAVERSMRRRFELVTASRGEVALGRLALEGPFAVLVADMRMPEMNGVQLLARVKKEYPDVIRVMMTGNADQETAVLAVNEGQVFQFLNKPCSMEMLSTVLETCLRQYQLITAERELLEKTLNGSVRLLVDILAMSDPISFGRGQTLRGHMRSYLNGFELENSWELEMAALCGSLGTVTVPRALVEKQRAGQPLTDQENEILGRAPQNAADLLGHIPRLESVARIVRYQQKHYDGSGFPQDDVRGEDIPIGSRILKVLTDLVDLETQHLRKDAALSRLQERVGWYDPRVLDAVFASFDVYLTAALAGRVGEAIPVKELRVGQTVVADIQTITDITIVPAHSQITPVLLLRIQTFSRYCPIQEPIYIEA
jgi:response regulator RpfG family c-di-GMP phosphodiesterase